MGNLLGENICVHTFAFLYNIGTRELRAVFSPEERKHSL